MEAREIIAAAVGGAIGGIVLYVFWHFVRGYAL